VSIAKAVSQAVPSRLKSVKIQLGFRYVSAGKKGTIQLLAYTGQAQ